MSDHENKHLVGTYPYIPKQERAQQKRKSLLESGLQLFIHHGYEHTTAKEIALHAGVATGTFYRYFSDKRQLLLSLLEDKLEHLLPPEPNWIHSNPEVLAKLLAQHYEQIEGFQLFRVLPELVIRDLELAHVLDELRLNWHNRIFIGLQNAKQQGLTWDDLDLNLVAWSILVLLENIPKYQHGKDQVDYYELAKVICRLVFPPEDHE
ncbi:TetR/AcrR family transcriptional regulator [Niallia sp. XMNu-256]|uniref:TetR/AcrR family transcriptional regulator n=1 Tax=Niallia sp. XMNu-256 TaxID=3082444 RepID=UPI0030D5BB83